MGWITYIGLMLFLWFINKGIKTNEDGEANPWIVGFAIFITLGFIGQSCNTEI